MPIAHLTPANDAIPDRDEHRAVHAEGACASNGSVRAHANETDDRDAYAFGGEVRPPALPEEESLVAQRPSDPAYRRQLRRDRAGNPRPSLGNLMTILEQTLAPRLTFNEMTACLHFDDLPLLDHHISAIRRDLETREQIEFSAENVREALVTVARARPFHPVQRYLRALRWDGVERIAGAATSFLGVPAEDTLSRRMVRDFFVAAVARAFKPGEKVDNVLVLLGGQGFKKSTFFDVLGGAWYGDSAIDLGDRKGVMTLHSSWIYEWPEVERVMARKLDSEVKAFISQRSDSFVPMYGRAPVKLLRSVVIVGTTNEEHFLSDPTGSRRWWIVRVRKKIDIALVQEQREQLWAEAVAEYERYLETERAGGCIDDNPHRWWLSDEDEREREVRAERHNAPDPWEETIGGWLAGGPVPCAACRGASTGGSGDRTCPACKGIGSVTHPPFSRDKDQQEYVTQADVLTGALGIPVERHKGQGPKIASVLRKLGWTTPTGDYRPKRDGQKVTPYYRPADPRADPDAPAPSLGTS